jgi:hypothetical protein
MKKQSSISKASSYKEIGEFWDTHDATDYVEDGNGLKMTFDIDAEVTYCALDNQLVDPLQKAAKKHGVSSDTLLNMWVQDKLHHETPH